MYFLLKVQFGEFKGKVSSSMQHKLVSMCVIQEGVRKKVYSAAFEETSLMRVIAQLRVVVRLQKESVFKPAQTLTAI